VTGQTLDHCRIESKLGEGGIETLRALRVLRYWNA
jgi:hypothetical protein